MQFKLISALALATLAVATPTGSPPPPPPASQCNTGDLQCCNSVQQANSLSGIALLSLVGVAVGSVTGLIGGTCSPITAIGVGGNSCSAQPVCCSNNSFNGLVAIGCTPVNINL
ncbi:fungal hydrophobin-domain-containing protein [Crassisporium funariophilum]|nr:fungal hydrophobin-domain-containing protein [Crassisporium funariophilum]